MTMTSEDILVYTILGFIIFSVLFTIIYLNKLNI